MVTTTKADEGAKAAAAPAPVMGAATVVSQVERFTPEPAQETWIELEKQREAARLDPAQNPWVRAAEAGVAFFNSPQQNDQWIGVGPLDQKKFPGVDISTVRVVPINTSEVLQAARKVIFPSGDTMVLPTGITSPDQIVHPETGERLVPEAKKK
jgi:hypothetical protein